MFQRAPLCALIALTLTTAVACDDGAASPPPTNPGASNPGGGSNDPDDGNGGNTDSGGQSCTGDCTPEALRVSKLTLVDPHVYLSGCVDVTTSGLFSVNDLLSDAIGKGDVNVLMVLAPYGADKGNGTLDVADRADCNSKQNPSSCTPKTFVASDLATTVTASGGSCFTADPSTLNDAYTAPASAAAPCFASGTTSLTIEVAGLKIPLVNARVASSFATGSSPGLVNGVLSGFLTLEEAGKVTLPADTPIVGGDKLTQHLAAGTSQSGCSTVDDTDTAMINGASSKGYWFYFDFEASPVDLGAATTPGT
jgi:hypothetical protein